MTLAAAGGRWTEVGAQPASGDSVTLDELRNDKHEIELDETPANASEPSVTGEAYLDKRIGEQSMGDYLAAVTLDCVDGVVHGRITVLVEHQTGVRSPVLWEAYHPLDKVQRVASQNGVDCSHAEAVKSARFRVLMDIGRLLEGSVNVVSFVNAANDDDISAAGINWIPWIPPSSPG